MGRRRRRRRHSVSTSIHPFPLFARGSSILSRKKEGKGKNFLSPPPIVFAFDAGKEKCNHRRTRGVVRSQPWTDMEGLFAIHHPRAKIKISPPALGFPAREGNKIGSLLHRPVARFAFFAFIIIIVCGRNKRESFFCEQCNDDGRMCAADNNGGNRLVTYAADTCTHILTSSRM